MADSDHYTRTDVAGWHHEAFDTGIINSVEAPSPNVSHVTFDTADLSGEGDEMTFGDFDSHDGDPLPPADTASHMSSAMTQVDNAPKHWRNVPGATALTGAGIFLRERIIGITGILKPPRATQHTQPMWSGNTRTPPNSAMTAVSHSVPVATHPTPSDRTRPHSQMQRSHDPTDHSASMPSDGHGEHPRVHHNCQSGHATSSGGAGSGDGGDDDNGSDKEDANSYASKHDTCTNRCDPPWTSPNRDGFHYRSSRHQLIHDQDARPYKSGSTWTMWTVNPLDPEFIVDPSTSSVCPWLAHHPNCSTVLCHPITHIAHFQDKEFFLSSFNDWQLFNLSNTKQMLHDVPILPNNGNVLQFHSRLVTAMIGWVVFVPPMQTVRDGQPLGIWYPKLPTYIKSLIHTVFSGMLALFLQYKDKGLIYHPVYGQLVKQHENGYIILQQLLVYAGHPLLEAFPTTPMEPHQLADTKLTDYMIAWTGYCLNHALYGQHLSDRYFLQQFLWNLHSSLKEVADYVEREESLCHPDEPLPYTLSPDGLFSTFLQHSKHLGKPQLALQSPCEHQHSSLSIRELSHHAMDPDLLIASLGSAPHDPSCFLCGNPDHLAPACPHLDAIQQDAFKSRLILKLLKPVGPPGAPCSNLPPKNICALTDGLSDGLSDDDTHSDDSTIMHENAPSDDNAFASPSPDFP